MNISDLHEELIIKILSYLSDMELARIAEVSKRFYKLRSMTLLSNINYRDDTNPITPRGNKVTPITAQQHAIAAHLTLEQCFGIRISPRTYQQVFLYRNSDKDNLTAKEKKSTVPSSSQGRSSYSLQHNQITPFWTVEKTAAWILGGLYSRLPFFLVSSPTQKINFIEGNVNHRALISRPAIYAREILQILSAGYTVDLAGPEETPYKLRNAQADALIILRPPAGPYTDIQTRLIPGLWNRDNKTLDSLFITYNGKAITADNLNVAMQEEIDAIMDAIDEAASIIHSFKYG